MATIVAFHIGRGGRFHNPGTKKFLDYDKKLPDYFANCTIICADDDGNPLPDEQWELIDCDGSTILKGREEIESETGVLDYDGEYDTYIVQHIDDCDDEEIQLLLEAYGKNKIPDRLIPEIMATYSAALTLYDKEDSVIYTGTSTEKLIEYAFEEPCKLVAEDVVLWQTEVGEEWLREILKDY